MFKVQRLELVFLYYYIATCKGKRKDTFFAKIKYRVLSLMSVQKKTTTKNGSNFACIIQTMRPTSYLLDLLHRQKTL